MPSFTAGGEAAPLTPVDFNADEHKYYVGTRELRSVTKVLAAVGLSNMWWADEEDRLRGQAVHQACRLIVRGLWSEEGKHPVVIPYTRAAQRFVREKNYRSLGGEIPLGNVRLGYAGTPDDWGMAMDRDTGEDKLRLVDFKSGGMPKTIGIQMAAYDKLLQVELGIVVESRWGVQLFADETYKIHPYDQTRWPGAWQSCLNVVNLQAEMGMIPKEKRSNERSRAGQGLG